MVNVQRVDVVPSQFGKTVTTTLEVPDGIVTVAEMGELPVDMQPLS